MIHLLPAWFLILWLSGFLTPAGAIVLLSVSFLLIIPLIMRFPYSMCSLDGNTLNFHSVKFLGLPLSRKIVVDITDPGVEWTIIKRLVNIAPRQGAPYVLLMKRPGRRPIWLACAASKKYLEREIDELTRAKL